MPRKGLVVWAEDPIQISQIFFWNKIHEISVYINLAYLLDLIKHVCLFGDSY